MRRPTFEVGDGEKALRRHRDEKSQEGDHGVEHAETAILGRSDVLGKQDKQHEAYPLIEKGEERKQTAIEQSLVTRNFGFYSTQSHGFWDL